MGHVLPAPSATPPMGQSLGMEQEAAVPSVSFLSLPCPLPVLPVPLSGFYSLTGSGVAAWDRLSSSHDTPAHPGELGWDIPACPQREQP